ncbi:hypothetical protein J2T12_001229 [Paenibacillus anaericanus]|uniref:hypothetical protein n=1 Tax=Paenibacillus anaericanus TaxID=170367 RepID=UPI0027849941|nr:hypothetical protein [Paenibacillus anaericanus]MDQ0087823.1 hypothetical protein [Paenibacillus anaericanus]
MITNGFLIILLLLTIVKWVKYLLGRKRVLSSEQVNTALLDLLNQERGQQDPNHNNELNSSRRIPAPLGSLHKSMYAYEKLRVCTHCERYTVLHEPSCLFCGKGTLRPVHWKAEKLVRRSMRNELLLTLLVTLLAILFAHGADQIIIACVGGAAAIALLWLNQRKTLSPRTYGELVKLFTRNRQKIIDGLIKNLDTAVEVGNNKEHKRSYEMFREVATLVQNDHIRMLQIMQLQSFVLRSDMDLELEPLMLKHFDPHLAAYIGELAKVKRELIKDNALRYVTSYEDEILDMKDGLSILIGAAGAAVRKKRYVAIYARFMARYASKLPKERFLRLYRVISGHPEQEWGELADIVSRLYEEQYGMDPESQTSLTRGHSI